MKPVLHRDRSSRRSSAVGLWSIVTVLTAVAVTDISFGLSLLWIMIVSVVSSAALLLIRISPYPDPRIGKRNAQIALAISLAIPIGWSILLGWNHSPLASAVMCALGIFPVIATSQLTFEPSNSLTSDAASPTLQDFKQSHPAPVVSKSDLTDVLTLHRNELSVHSLLEKDIPPTDEESSDDEFPDAETQIPPSVTQWMTRSLTDDGDVIEGGVRIDFAKGQRDITVHLSFCPPFREIPEIETEDLDGSDLEIRVAASFPFGARMTVRRSAIKNEQGISLAADTSRIGFVAVAHPIRRAA